MKFETFVALTTFAAGCGDPVEASVRSTAARELSCPDSALTVTPLGGGMVMHSASHLDFAVDGCGSHKDYTCCIPLRESWFEWNSVYACSADHLH